jgi:hypothetical protein
MAGVCWAKGPDGRKRFALPQLGEHETSVWIDNYPQVCVSALAWLQTNLLAASNGDQDKDGLVGGRWLRWKGKRQAVPQGVVYRLLEYMWDRDSASYSQLEDASVFNSSVQPQTVRSYANKANNALPAGFPWRLSTDSMTRQLTKISVANAG